MLAARLATAADLAFAQDRARAAGDYSRFGDIETGRTPTVPAG